jgi:glycosyltransferase involved in cell wall biosynthesis
LIEGVTEFNRRTGADYQLLLAGASGWQDEDVFRAATAAQCVNMSGYVPDADLPALYSLAEALVYPSSYEGFGLPPLEAMACGVPVLAANSSCLPEVIGDAGLLLEEISPDAIADALTRLMSSDELRADLVRRGLTRASSFTWRQTAEKCLKLYQLMEAGRA